MNWRALALATALLAAPANALACGAYPAGMNASDLVLGMVANGADIVTSTSQTNAGTSRQGMLVYNRSNNTLLMCDGSSWRTLAAAGGVAAAGTTGQVQFNNAGALGADTGLHWDNTNKRLGVGTTTPTVSLDVATAIGLTTAAGKGPSLAYVVSDYPTLGFNAYGTAYTAGEAGYGGLLQFRNSTGDLIYYSGSNVAAGANHSHTALVTIKQNGNVGIGTMSPTAKLHVYSAASNVIYTQGGGIIAQLGADGSTQGNAGTYTNHPFTLITNNVERMRIDSSGNVGIGTTAPVSPLHIRAASAGSNVLTLGDGRTNDFNWLNFKGSPQVTGGYTIGGLQAYSSLVTADTRVGVLQFAKEGSGTDNKTYFEISTHNGTAYGERMRIDSAGNVGVKTTTPEATLDINGPQVIRGDNTGYGVFQPKFGTSVFGANYDRFEIRVDPSTQVTYIGNVHAGTGTARALGVMAGGTERIRVGASGNVGIGTSDPAATLEVISTVAVNPRGIQSTQYTNDTIGSQIGLRKARGTVSSPAALQSADAIGGLVFYGYDGS